MRQNLERKRLGAAVIYKGEIAFWSTCAWFYKSGLFLLHVTFGFGSTNTLVYIFSNVLDMSIHRILICLWFSLKYISSSCGK